MKTKQEQRAALEATVFESFQKISALLRYYEENYPGPVAEQLRQALSVGTQAVVDLVRL